MGATIVQTQRGAMAADDVHAETLAGPGRDQIGDLVVRPRGGELLEDRRAAVVPLVAAPRQAVQGCISGSLKQGIAPGIGADSMGGYALVDMIIT